ncbi:hypothetical protein DPMN_164199 [Dreissena polymorpha]|uniref:Uncharacterized protein n=1 Tax=Dreissena polymorpha TaxID=45954 RepID=A0A9D4EUP9_DREPO|nr:hypothetical protein DPMN_164199 [Dreissena polymorpha]
MLFHIAISTLLLSGKGLQESETKPWFISMRMGVKTCAFFGAGIIMKLANHSTVKHMVQNLRESGGCPTDITQISGYKNLQSIINYSNISLQTQN